GGEINPEHDVISVWCKISAHPKNCKYLFLPMNRFCERCERTTHDGNLWCPEPDCPAEAGYALFGYGDFLGDLKITKLVRAWRTAALYEAARGETQVLVKVAHHSDETEERLRRDAHAFES